MLLTRQILELGDASVGMFVRVVDHGAGLKPLAVVRLELEVYGTIRQLPEPIVEEPVDGARVDELLEAHFIHDVLIVGVQEDTNVGVVQHPLEHARVTV
jgi:hypothetical protein